MANDMILGNRIVKEELHDLDDDKLRELIAKGQAYDQVAWERNVAIKQLNAIGCNLGEKMDPYLDAIKKQEKAKIIVDSKAKDDLVYKCPCCGTAYNRFYTDKPYCMYCGQALDFSDVAE